MKFNTKDIKFVQQGFEYFIIIKPPKILLDKIKNLIDKDVEKTIEIKQKRNKRSLDANAYMWQLINKIAIKLGSTDKEVYERMLRDYGTKEYVAAVPESRTVLLKVYKIVEVVKKARVNNSIGTVFRLIRGSSTYDTKEMSILIDGVVQEAKALNIETMTPNEVKSMMDNYK